MPATPEHQPSNNPLTEEILSSEPSTQGTPSPESPIQDTTLTEPHAEDVPISMPLDGPTGAPRPTSRPLPDSPLERARLESQGQIPLRSEADDRSTMVAFGLLFVVPILIILFSVLLLLPFINAQLTSDADPGGATVQTGPNLPPPTR